MLLVLLLHLVYLVAWMANLVMLHGGSCKNRYHPSVAYQQNLRWLFYIEGAITIFVAIVAIFILPDFPPTTRGLTDQERALAIRRMEEDVGVGDEDQTEGGSSGFWLAMTDVKVWWLAFALTAQVIALSFNAYFPTLAATLGYSPTVSLLLCAPPWGFAVLVSAALSW
jgi:sugar phosphate permease